MFQPGDAVAIGHSTGFWTGWRFVAQDARGLVLAGVLPTQPPLCVVAHPVPIVAAADAVFSFRCPTCAGDGKLENWRRRKIAGPSIEELRGAEYIPSAIVACPVCDGEGMTTWDPFLERPGCALPPLFTPVREPVTGWDAQAALCS